MFPSTTAAKNSDLSHIVCKISLKNIKGKISFLLLELKMRTICIIYRFWGAYMYLESFCLKG